MGFTEGIAAWIVKLLLEWLYGKAMTAVKDTVAEVKLDHERSEINEENVKKYEEALNRKERIDAALGLLNRTRG